MLRVPNAVLFYFLFPFLVFPVEDNLVSLMEMGGNPLFFKKKKEPPATAGDAIWQGRRPARTWALRPWSRAESETIIFSHAGLKHFSPHRAVQLSLRVARRAASMTNRLSWLPGRSTHSSASASYSSVW
jgi:hypothetical protein